MNKRSKFLLTLIYSLVMIGLITRQQPILVFAIPFVIFLVAGLVFEPQAIQLEVDRKLSANRVRQGTPVSVILTITNTGSPIESLIVEDIVPSELEIVDGIPKILTTLKTGETATIKYSLRPKRGLYQLPGLRTTASDHLGLFPRHKEFKIINQITVVPETYALPEVMIRPRRTRVYPGVIPSKRGGPGVEFFGVRAYHPGDPKRWINHKVSARQEQTLFVNQYEQEKAVDVGLILDCRVETNLFRGNRELLEHGTQAAATLSETFLAYGNRVGLLIYGGGRKWVHPGYGKHQRERILQALAGVQLYDYVVSKELSNLPTRLFPARSQLVLISSLLYQDLPTLLALRAHGYQLLVISPDPIDFEQKLLGKSQVVTQAARIARLERDFMLHQIQQTGARVLEWQVDKPFFHLANTRLTKSTFWDQNQVAGYA